MERRAEDQKNINNSITGTVRESRRVEILDANYLSVVSQVFIASRITSLNLPTFSRKLLIYYQSNLYASWASKLVPDQFTSVTSSRNLTVGGIGAIILSPVSTSTLTTF
jgi:hypothetical protein